MNELCSYPEHDKLAAVKEQSQAIGEFLDSSGYTLCTWQEADVTEDVHPYVWQPGKSRATACRSIGPELPDRWDFYNDDASENPDYEEWEDRFVPVRGGIQEILAKHFGIDLDALEAEKRRMLEEIAAGTPRA